MLKRYQRRYFKRPADGYPLNTTQASARVFSIFRAQSPSEFS